MTEPTTPESLADLMVELLRGRTAAGENVFAFRDWPTTPYQFPIILLDQPDDDMVGQGRGSVGFTTTAVITLHAQVQAEAKVDDKGANAVRTALAALKAQIKTALINRPALMIHLQQIAGVRSKASLSDDGEDHLGELAMQFRLEFYQDAWDFAPDEGIALEAAHIVADMQAPADRLGVYADAEFPASVQPAPRSEGPDGRAEAVLDIDLRGDA